MHKRYCASPFRGAEGEHTHGGGWAYTCFSLRLRYATLSLSFACKRGLRKGETNMAAVCVEKRERSMVIHTDTPRRGERKKGQMALLQQHTHGERTTDRWGVRSWRGKRPRRFASGPSFSPLFFFSCTSSSSLFSPPTLLNIGWYSGVPFPLSCLCCMCC